MDVIVLIIVTILFILFIYHIEDIEEYVSLAVSLFPYIIFACMMWIFMAGTRSFTISFVYKGKDKEINVG